MTSCLRVTAKAVGGYLPDITLAQVRVTAEVTFILQVGFPEANTLLCSTCVLWWEYIAGFLIKPLRSDIAVNSEASCYPGELLGFTKQCCRFGLYDVTMPLGILWDFAPKMSPMSEKSTLCPTPCFQVSEYKFKLNYKVAFEKRSGKSEIYQIVVRRQRFGNKGLPLASNNQGELCRFYLE